MTTIPVVWMKAHPLCWDQALIDDLLHNRIWRTGLTFTHHVDEIPAGVRGAIVICPARYFTPADVDALIAPLRWCVLLLTSDEESTFPWRDLQHQNCAVWVMTPRPELHAEHDRFLGEYWPPGTPEALRDCWGEADLRPLNWFFAGQVNHARRVLASEAMSSMDGGELVLTAGFTQGLDRAEYLRHMAEAKVIPCPSGPGTQDSFRVYEALEAGCVPVADVRTPDDRLGYWQLLLDGDPPFPTIDDWGDLPTITDRVLNDWPASANRCFAWWQQHKRSLAHRIVDDVCARSGLERSTTDLADLVTVVVPTSPIPSHPDTDIITETIRSIRASGLADVDIILACDGVRDEQHHHSGAYDEYLRRLLWSTNHEWDNVVPLLAREHLHQANLTREALRLVRTPLVVFVEHDTPVCGDIPWKDLANVVLAGDANLVRLHHEAHILDVHQHLMLEDEPAVVRGVPLLRTAQWSQRPHIASTGFYRDFIDRYFPTTCRTMIEDRMHGVVESAWREEGAAGWGRWRLFMYAPGGDMKRSFHLDGRAGDPKFDMRYE